MEEHGMILNLLIAINDFQNSDPINHHFLYYIKKLFFESVIYFLFALSVINNFRNEISKSVFEKYVVFLYSVIMLIYTTLANDISYEMVILFFWNLIFLFQRIPQKLSNTLRLLCSTLLVGSLFLNSNAYYSWESFFTFSTLTFVKIISCMWFTYLLLNNKYIKQIKETTLLIYRMGTLYGAYIICLTCMTVFGLILFISLNQSQHYLLIMIISAISLLLAGFGYYLLKNSLNNMFHFRINFRLNIKLVAISTVILLLIPSTFIKYSNSLIQPIYWHKMGEEAHLTFQVIPDSNKFDLQYIKLDIWLQPQAGSPQNIELEIRTPNETVTPLMHENVVNNKEILFSNYNKFSYSNEGSYITHSERLNVFIRFTDELGSKYEYENEVTP